MSIDSQVVSHLAKLSKLKIDDDHEQLTNQLNNILAFVEQIKKADTSDLKPMSHPLDVAQPLRIDEVTENPNRDSLIKNAPETHEGFFLVPKVID